MSTRTLVIKETSYTVPRYIHRYVDGSWMVRFLGINKVWQDASYNGTRAALNEAIKYLHALVCIALSQEALHLSLQQLLRELLAQALQHS